VILEGTAFIKLPIEVDHKIYCSKYESLKKSFGEDLINEYAENISIMKEYETEMEKEATSLKTFGM